MILEKFKLQASFEVLEGVEHRPGLGPDGGAYQLLSPERRVRQPRPALIQVTHTHESQVHLDSGLHSFSKSFHSLHSCTGLPQTLIKTQNVPSEKS